MYGTAAPVAPPDALAARTLRRPLVRFRFARFLAIRSWRVRLRIIRFLSAPPLVPSPAGAATRAEAS